jgi:tetratricopeptide (TPR) repeat protein
VSFESALASAIARPTDPDALAELAGHALREGEEEQALPFLWRAVGQSPTARLWQWKGLLERALDEHEQAVASFDAAAAMEPSDANIAHGRARVALEAGLPAEHLYEHALHLDPADGALRIGLAAARLAAGSGEQAEAELDAALRQSPLWVDGHNQLAQLRSMLGRPELAPASLEHALQRLPGEALLWQALFDLRLKTERFAELDAAVAAAARAGADRPLLRTYETIAAAELGQVARADRLFAEAEESGADIPAVWQIRHLLRTGRAERALPLIDNGLRGSRAASVWPYASVAWRLGGDSRRDWLEQNGKLISIVDLASKLPSLERLADLLRSLHMSRGEYLDQSVRGGTQTDGPLFSRVEPAIRLLRAAVVDAIETYAAQLPSPDPRHPLLSQRRDRRIRFAGSWSVRLKQAGFHVSHVHPLGWISSALYIALPPAVNAESKEGWLQLGNPRPELGVDLEPSAYVRPEPGRLVLFPSWMWHGTIPFSAGERLTVAFDVAVPR